MLRVCLDWERILGIGRSKSDEGRVCLLPWYIYTRDVGARWAPTYYPPSLPPCSLNRALLLFPIFAASLLPFAPSLHPSIHLASQLRLYTNTGKNICDYMISLHLTWSVSISQPRHANSPYARSLASSLSPPKTNKNKNRSSERPLLSLSIYVRPQPKNAIVKSRPFPHSRR